MRETTIRPQLKRKGENCYWTEIVRRMSTQKLVTTKAVNPFDELVETRICSLPTEAAADIYNKLGYRHYPFRKNENLYYPNIRPTNDKMLTTGGLG